MVALLIRRKGGISLLVVGQVLGTAYVTIDDIGTYDICTNGTCERALLCTYSTYVAVCQACCLRTAAVFYCCCTGCTGEFRYDQTLLHA